VRVANLLAGSAINPDGHSSLLSFHFPQWCGFRDVSNWRTRCRLMACIMPVRAKIIGAAILRGLGHHAGSGLDLRHRVFGLWNFFGKIGDGRFEGA
jgi:hypothetical protein